MSTVQEQLIKHLDEAHAMEQSVLRMLDGMISTTDDPEIQQELEHHKIETEGHAQRMKGRLAATARRRPRSGSSAASSARSRSCRSTWCAARRPGATRATDTRPSTWRSRATSS